MSKYEFLDVHDFLTKNKITRYKILDNGSIDIMQSVDISSLDLTKIPYPIYRVRGNFNASKNKLSDLTNAPKVVYGEYDVSNNNLISLLGVPKKVKILRAAHNKLTSLEHCPNTTDLIVYNNNILSLKYIHPNVSFLSIMENVNLKNLEYLPSNMDSLILCNTGITQIDKPLIINKTLQLKNTKIEYIYLDKIILQPSAKFMCDVKFMYNCINSIEFVEKFKNHLDTVNSNYKELFEEYPKIIEFRKTKAILNLL